MCYIGRFVTRRSTTHIFSDQPFFYKLLSHVFKLDLDKLPYTMLHEVICIAASQNNTLLVNMMEDEDEEDLCMTLMEKYISSDSFEATSMYTTSHFVGDGVENNLYQANRQIPHKKLVCLN